jgi:DNA-binding CsgD family transcriptional regulator
MGDLEAADRTARAALHAAEQTSEPWLTTVATAVLVAALTQRGELVAAQQALEDRDLADTPVATFFHAEVTTARAGLHLARERPAEARADALAVGHFATAAGVRNPVMLPWRPLAALASIALGQRDEASQLAREELELATAADIPSAIGAAQRVLALTVDGEPMVTGLERAVATLETTPARLELARALTDFGASLRRGGRRTDARGPLSQALELAHRCGAAPLAELARTELLAAGARPRRAFRTGIDALTPSERRVADLAAAGLTNAEIAARLFITIKTTEHHLAAVYRKLDINSRRRLPGELADPRRDEPS